MLTNPIYIGKVTLHGEVFEGKHDGIIDPELFDDVQTMLADNSVQQGNLKRNRHDALLKGLLHCTACDAPFSHTYTKKKNRMYRYYTCSQKRFKGPCTCLSPSLSAGEIERIVTDQLLSIGSNPELQSTVYSQLCAVIAQKKTEKEQQIKTAKQQLTRIQRELQSSREFDAPEQLISHLELQRAEADQLLEKASSAKLNKPIKKMIQETLSNMHELWPSFNAGEKCDFVKTLVQRVDYDAIAERITLHFNENSFDLGGSE
jgi:site-specific DNA recombinase